MLTEIVEAREAARAMALERSLAGVFSAQLSAREKRGRGRERGGEREGKREKEREGNTPDVAGQMLAASEAQVARGIFGAMEQLAFLVLLIVVVILLSFLFLIFGIAGGGIVVRVELIVVVVVMEHVHVSGTIFGHSAWVGSEVENGWKGRKRSGRQRSLTR